MICLWQLQMPILFSELTQRNTAKAQKTGLKSVDNEIIQRKRRIMVAYAGLISFPGNDCVVVVTSAGGK